MVVYDDATGNTHHLGPLASRVLRKLLDNRQGLALEALLTCIDDDVEKETASASAEIASVVDEFLRLRLIESLRS